MKVSNETKVGALTIIAITLIILGFNFLRGKTIFKSGNFIYAKYADTKGLIISNPVFVNGFQVGTVFDIENQTADLSQIVVSIKLNNTYKITRLTKKNKAKSNTLKQIESNIKRTENELKQAKAQNPGSPLNKLTGGRRKRTKKRRTRRA